MRWQEKYKECIGNIEDLVWYQKLGDRERLILQ